MNDALISRRGLLYVVSSPSGAGKTTLCRELLAAEGPNLSLSVSVTTRQRRSAEVDGVDYRFVEPTQFSEMVEAGELLEHADVFGARYGTPRGPVDAWLGEGRDVLFDVDWQGARQLRESALKNDVVSVFILPPSLAELERRLLRRNQDAADIVVRRMAKARDEISHCGEYDYVVVNVDLAASAATLRAILAAERARRARLTGLDAFLADLR